MKKKRAAEEKEKMKAKKTAWEEKGAMYATIVFVVIFAIAYILFRRYQKKNEYYSNIVPSQPSFA